MTKRVEELFVFVIVDPTDGIEKMLATRDAKGMMSFFLTDYPGGLERFTALANAEAEALGVPLKVAHFSRVVQE